MMERTEFSYDKVNVKNFGGHRDEVNCVALSPDLEIMVTGSDDSRIRLFNTISGDLVTTLAGHLNAVTTVAISPNSRHIASASYDKTVRIWLTREARCVRVLTDHTKSVECLSFSHDSVLLCSGSWDKTAILWAVQDGDHVATLSGHQSLVQCCAFSYDGGHVATGSWDYSIFLWVISRLEDGRVDPDNIHHTQTLAGHTGNVRMVAFSREGMLASGSWDKTIRIWNPVNGRCIFVLGGHGGWVQAIAFSSDSLYLASAGDHDVLRIWDCSTGQCVKTLDLGETETVSQCVFGPNGVVMASGCGTMRTASK